jgi:hypothetical protein
LRLCLGEVIEKHVIGVGENRKLARKIQLQPAGGEDEIHIPLSTPIVNRRTENAASLILIWTQSLFAI